jgi:zinc protease
MSGRTSPRRVPGLIAAAAVLLGLGAASAGGQERFRRTPPLPEAQPVELRLPPVETSVLSNGLTVAVAPRPGSTVVTLMLVIRAGEADSPPELPGLAAMTARMIGKGTRLLSANQLENMVEAMGATYSVTVLMDYTVLSLRVLAEQLDRAMLVLRIMALDATFSERELAAVRRNAFWELAERKKDPESLAWSHLLRVLFENHPYRTATYTEDVIKFISAKDAAAFYDRFYRPGNAAVLAFGDIDGPETAKRVSSHFAAWAGPAPERPPAVPPGPNMRERICYVESPGVENATIFAGNVIMDASDPAFFPFLVLKQVLGGTTGSRLFMNLRESKGYAYYAFSETEFFRECGVYWARALVRPGSIVPATREILGEIATLAAQPGPPAEIEEAKSFLIGNLPLRFSTPEGFGEWMARYVALGLDESHWDRALESLTRVNGERVREAARKHLAAKPVVVIVGRPEWVASLAAEFEVVEAYDTNGKLLYTMNKNKGDGS